METQMATAPPSQQKAANLARTFTKLLRRKRSAAVGAPEAAASVAGDEYDDALDSSITSLSKLKLSGNLAAAYSLDAFFRNAAEKKDASQPSPTAPPDAAVDSLLANLFVGAAVVAELTRLSDIKRRYLKDPASAAKSVVAGSTALAAQAEEQRHLLKTYQITARKLEAELRTKDADLERAKNALAAELRVESRLHPGRTLASLDDLHLSGLNPTHFLIALRHTVKSIRSFAKSMLNSMQSAGWDLAAAAAAVHPGVPLRRAGNAKFVFESYISMKMFANFHRRDFNLSFLEEREFYDRRRFFEEFTELKSAPAAVFLDGRNSRWSGLGKFLRTKYLSLVLARMETAFPKTKLFCVTALHGDGIFQIKAQFAVAWSTSPVSQW